jgi:hypothetical protein
MAIQPPTRLRATCLFKKANGEHCKRSIAPGEDKCWQHADSFNHKWKSLTTGQTFQLTVALLTIIGTPLGLYFGYIGWLHSPPTREEIAKEVVKQLPPPPRQHDVERTPTETLTTKDTSTAKRGNKPASPSTPNLGPSRESGAAFYDLTSEQRGRFVKMLAAQTAPKDSVRIGCTSWSETSCIAAGKFLLMFSEAGWQIEGDKVFRLEPQIPIAGVALATHTAPGEPTEKLPPHLGRWRLGDESLKTVFWAFHVLNIPTNGATDDSLQNNSLGIYFGPESK